MDGWWVGGWVDGWMFHSMFEPMCDFFCDFVIFGKLFSLLFMMVISKLLTVFNSLHLSSPSKCIYCIIDFFLGQQGMESAELPGRCCPSRDPDADLESHKRRRVCLVSSAMHFVQTVVRL